MNTRVILASGSPRRQELLKYIIPKFDVIPSDIEEIAEGTPDEQVMQLARDKAADIAGKHPNALVIGADTLVALNGKIFGKPKDEQEAGAMLNALSGNTHQVYTGVAVMNGQECMTEYAVTDVTFSALTKGEIDAYIATGEPMGKAGAYGIQGYGGKFVPKIEGCYFNVMGLPLSVLYGMLKKFDA